MNYKMTKISLSFFRYLQWFTVWLVKCLLM
jgi:hypothetical protein